MNHLGLPTSFGVRKQNFKQKKRSQHEGEQFEATIDYNVDEAFNKCFLIYCEDTLDVQLPEPESLFTEDKWKIDHFQQLKFVLNNTKSKLNDLNLKEWHQHTTNTNIAGDVIKKIKYSVRPEFLTQAWCKMYECLMNFGVVPQGGEVFNSVHLCEAPGAFITALHHFIQTWYPQTEWNWLATTLNPYHEGNPPSQMIQDDRFILHTLRHWVFGEDGTGNIMDIDNLQHLQAQVNSRLSANVTLVTADGSIDCQTNPSEQEVLVAPLHYCEALTALSILQPGGSFVLKMFTLLECESICLMYLLVRTFSLVYVFKPVKSKEGNSEVYVVCSGYKGRDSLLRWMPVLKSHFGSSISKAMFCRKHIPEDFITQLYSCAKGFTDIQIRVIERNLDLFHCAEPSRLLQCRLVKRQVAERYLLHYQVVPVNKVIVGNDVLAETPLYNLAQKCEEGTFNDRIGKKCLRISVLLASARAAVCAWPFKHNICWFKFNNLKWPALDIMLGRPITTVNSSKFCHSQVLDAFNQVKSAQLHNSTVCELETSMTLDLGDLPWATQHSHCYHDMLSRVSCILENLPVSRSLCIRGLPLLSQFTVAAVFLLAHSFYQVGLTAEGNVILCDYRPALTCSDWLQDVLKQTSCLPNSKSVLSLLPINVLCDKMYCMDNGVSFYFCVTSINNARLLRSLEIEEQQIQTAELTADPTNCEPT